MATAAKWDYLSSVECSDQPMDFCFHPKQENILVAGLVDGSVEVHDIRAKELDDDDDDDELDSILSSLSLHTQLIPGQKKTASCRTVEFSVDGQRIYTGGSAGDLCCIDAERICKFSTTPPSGSLSWRVEPATEGSFNPLLIVRPFENSTSLLATGDDTGGVRVWDERLCGSSSSTTAQRLPQGCVLSWKKNEDFISGIEHSEDGHTLLASSADGRLAVFDMRMARDSQNNNNGGKPSFRLSDDQEDELLSLKIIKNGKKVVCGTQEGVLSVFSWGRWGDCSDRFPGHPNSIDALLKVDEDTLLTGSSDGLIRVVQIHPDKLLGTIGHDHGGFPIEKLGFNASRHVVGSVSHDNHVHLSDARVLQDGSDDDGEEEDSHQDTKPAASLGATAGNSSDNDWDDMDKDEDEDSEEDDSDEDEDSDDSDDDDDEEKVATVNDRRKKRLKTDNEKFFDDL